MSTMLGLRYLVALLQHLSDGSLEMQFAIACPLTSSLATCFRPDKPPWCNLAARSGVNPCTNREQEVDTKRPAPERSSTMYSELVSGIFE
jgi:hypothetical protein